MEKILQTEELLSLQTGIPSGSIYVLSGVVLCLLFLFILAIILMKSGSKRRYIFNILRGTEELLRGNLDWKIEVRGQGDLARIATNMNQLMNDFKERSARVLETKDYFNNLVEGTLEYAIISASTDWDLVSFNSGAVALFGWKKEDIIGKNISMIFSEATWLNLLPLLARKDLGESASIHQGEFRKKDSSLFPGMMTMSTIRSKSGESIGYRVIIRDLSGQIDLEKDLSESEEKYRSMADGLREGVFILQDGKIVYSNASFAVIAGMERDEANGILFKDLIASDSLLSAVDDLRRLESRAVARINAEIMILDRKRKLPVEAIMNASCIMFKGRPAIAGSLIDISERRRIERAMKLSEKRLDVALDSVSEGIIMINGPYQRAVIVHANRSIQEIFGIEPRQIFGMTFEKVMDEIGGHVKDRECFARAMKNAMKMEKETCVEFIFEMEKPERRIVECFTASIADEKGSEQSRVFSFRDITGQKESERRLQDGAEDLKRSKDALETAYRELNIVNEDLQKRTLELDRLNQELKTLDEMKTKLIANVSHELQTPLVSIKGYTDMILKRKLGEITEEQERGLSISLRNIERLISMIDNLLNFARMGKTVEEIKPEVFPVWQVIDEAVELVREKMEASDISIMTKYETDDLMVRADREKISQVFINLMSNAVKFNRRGGEVSILVRKGSPDHLKIDVKDTGIGIPSEHLDKIFDRFYRVESKGAKLMEGTGIGLSIVKDILALHKCTITVMSRVGDGSTFTFTLPMAEAEFKDDGAEMPGSGKPVPDEEKASGQNGAKMEKPLNSENGEKGYRRPGVIKIRIIKNPLKNSTLTN